MNTALEGIRVLELTHVISGSVAGMLLGDLGAEVIKVERPKVGEFYREEAQKNSEGISIIYPTYNRNKKSLTLNLKSPQAREIVRRLAAKSDIVVENYRPGVLAKLGLAYEDLKKVKPDLIMVSISGFGQTGPYAARPAYDMTISAISGFMSMNGPVGQPTKNGPAVSDFLAGIYGCLAALAALRHREKTGEGQYVDIAMLECGISVLDAFFAQYRFTGTEPRCSGNRRENYAPVNAYKTKDGMAYISATLNKHWEALTTAMNRPDLFADPQNATGVLRKNHEDELETLVGDWAKNYSTNDIIVLLDKAGVPCAPVQGIAQVMQDPQVRFRKAITEFEYPGLGHYPAPSFVPKFSTMDVPVRRAPQLGENNKEILCSLLDYSDAEYQTLQKEETI